MTVLYSSESKWALQYAHSSESFRCSYFIKKLRHWLFFFFFNYLLTRSGCLFTREQMFTYKYAQQNKKFRQHYYNLQNCKLMNRRQLVCQFRIAIWGFHSVFSGYKDRVVGADSRRAKKNQIGPHCVGIYIFQQVP
jgi:hypothetical protein